MVIGSSSTLPLYIIQRILNEPWKNLLIYFTLGSWLFFPRSHPASCLLHWCQSPTHSRHSLTLAPLYIKNLFVWDCVYVWIYYLCFFGKFPVEDTCSICKSLSESLIAAISRARGSKQDDHSSNSSNLRRSLATRARWPRSRTRYHLSRMSTTIATHDKAPTVDQKRSGLVCTMARESVLIPPGRSGELTL